MSERDSSGSGSGSGAIDPKRAAALHREFVRRCRAEALHRPASANDWWRALFTTTIFFTAWTTLLLTPTWPGRLFALACGAFCALQGGFLAHDLSHRNITVRPWLVRLIGQFFLTIIGGQTYGHWEWQHLKHHSHTQHAFDDPDLEVSLFALSTQDARRKTGIRRWTTRWQHWLLWPLITLQAFSIRLNTSLFVLRHLRGTVPDQVGLIVHLLVWVAVPTWVLGPVPALVNYVLFTWFIGPYLAASFLWNHVGARVIAPGESVPYFVRQLDAARNLPDVPLYNFLFGGLNFHVEHHLAPNVPSSRLPSTRRILTQLLREQDLECPEWRFADAVRDVHRALRAYAAAARDGSDAGLPAAAVTLRDSPSL